MHTMNYQTGDHTHEEEPQLRAARIRALRLQRATDANTALNAGRDHIRQLIEAGEFEPVAQPERGPSA